MKNITQNWFLQAVVACLLGSALTLAFAPYNICPLAVIAFTGLLILIYPASRKQAAWLSFIFGIGNFGTGVSWVFLSIHDYSETPLPLAVLITAALIAFMAIFPMLAGYFTKRYFSNRGTIQLICAFPAFWVLLEWARSLLFTGFPWLLVGYSQTNSPLKGYAPLLGVYEVSLMVLMSSGLLASAIIEYKHKAYFSIYRNLLLITIIWIGGALTSLHQWTTPIGNPISVSLIQGNIPQSIKWDPNSVDLSLERYAQLTAGVLGKNKLIIWPEAAIPIPLQYAPEYIEKMADKAKAAQSTIILGIPIRNPQGDGYYNALITIGDSPEQTYLKRRLVPYGEYVPFKQYSASIFDFMHIPMAEMVPGALKQDPFTVHNIKILPSICYEIAYPELMNPRKNDVNLLLTVTNDAWFGKSAAQAQHLQMAMMRAQELQRPVLFVSNDGITAIIGADGNIQAQAQPYVVTILNGTVQPMTGLTPWMQHGMDPLLLAIIGLLFATWWSRKNATITNETGHERTISTARN